MAQAKNLRDARVAEEQRKRKERFDRNHRPADFKVGDLIAVHRRVVRVGEKKAF